MSTAVTLDADQGEMWQETMNPFTHFNRCLMLMLVNKWYCSVIVKAVTEILLTAVELDAELPSVCVML